MDKLLIEGGVPLSGEVSISGAKNAALPLMIASLLTDQTLTLENVPRLADVTQLKRILGNHGVDHSVNGRREKQGELYARTINFSARNIVDSADEVRETGKFAAVHALFLEQDPNIIDVFDLVEGARIQVRRDLPHRRFEAHHSLPRKIRLSIDYG